MDWSQHKENWPNAEFSSFHTVKPHRWHVQRAGQGPKVLLIHGAGGATHSWRHVFPVLAQNFDTLAIDLPGQGFSALGNRSRCDLPHMAEDLQRLLESLDFVPTAVVGHSAGAALMFWLALTEPTWKDARLVSINGALGNFEGIAGVLFPLLAKFLAINPFTASLFAASAGVMQRAAGLLKSTGSQIEQEGIRQYQVLISDSGHVDATLAMMAQWSLDDLRQRLRTLQNQTLFLAGENDKAVPPKVSKEFADQTPNGHALILPGLGHLMHEEDPDTCLAQILPAL